MKKGQTLKGELEKIHGAPKQYQEGYAEFYKLKFYLTQDVLIPRPETELLVDIVVNIVTSYSSTSNEKRETSDRVTILDLGTGSGCIAIALAKNLKDVKILATDISPKALEVAKKNAKFQRVEDKIFFLESDLLDFTKPKEHYDSLVNHTKIPDMIIANLPYIPTARLMLVDPMVRDFEPRLALDGGRDGFEVYRKLFAQISQQPSRLMSKYLIAEIDEEQGGIALAEAKNYFPNANIEIKKDLAKKDRILVIKFN